jgi:hypothetical protein
MTKEPYSPVGRVVLLMDVLMRMVLDAGRREKEAAGL